MGPQDLTMFFLIDSLSPNQIARKTEGGDQRQRLDSVSAYDIQWTNKTSIGTKRKRERAKKKKERRREEERRGEGEEREKERAILLG